MLSAAIVTRRETNLRTEDKTAMTTRTQRPMTTTTERPMTSTTERPTTLAARRRARGLTQEALARRAGISRITIARLERQGGAAWNPTIEVIARIARALGVSVGAVAGALRGARS